MRAIPAAQADGTFLQGENGLFSPKMFGFIRTEAIALLWTLQSNQHGKACQGIDLVFWWCRSRSLVKKRRSRKQQEVALTLWMAKFCKGCFTALSDGMGLYGRCGMRL